VIDDNGAYVKLANGGDARYLLPWGHSVDGRWRRGQARRRAGPPATESAKTRDITASPRVPSCSKRAGPRCAVIAEMDGRVEFGRDYKNKRRIKSPGRWWRSGRVPDPKASTSPSTTAT